MRPLVRSLLTSVPIIAAVVLSPSAAAASFAVTIQNFTFTPATVNAAVGDQVIWTNRDFVPHAVKWTSGGLADGAVLGQNQTYTAIFTSAGTYSYICGIHGPSMFGAVVVGSGQSPSPTAPPTPAPTLTPRPTATRTAPPSPSPSPPPQPSPSPSPTPSPSPSPSPSPTPPPTATPAAPSPSPSARASAPAAPAAAQANAALGLVLVVMGVGVLTATLWWRFGRTR